MRQRVTSKRKSRLAHRQESSAFFLIAVIACVPVIGSIWAVIATIQPDLSDLIPLNAQIEEYALLEWSALLGGHSAAPPLRSRVVSGASIQALGYMMDGAGPVRAGAPTRRFLLLPDAGNLLHPAHRFGDQMIMVELRNGDARPFSPRALVWVRGTLQISRGDPTGERAPVRSGECSRRTRPQV